MRALGRRGKTVFGGLALVAAFALVQVASASAATFPNACKNSVTPNQSQIGVTMTANTSPNPVAPGGAVSLTNIDQTANVPGTIFVAGYNLGLLTVGENMIPATAKTIIEATNTLEGAQATNTASSSMKSPSSSTRSRWIRTFSTRKISRSLRTMRCTPRMAESSRRKPPGSSIGITW